MAEIKSKPIEQMEIGDTVQGFFMVKESAVSADGKSFSMLLQDKTGKIPGIKILDDDDMEKLNLPETGSMLKVRGTVEENWDGKEICISLMRIPALSEIPDSAIMGHKDISTFISGEAVAGCYMVRMAAERTDKKGNLYLDINIGDKTGEVNCKLWGWKSGAGDKSQVPDVGKVVFVRGTVDEYQGRVQFKLDKLAQYNPTNTEMAALVPCAPESPEEMEKRIFETIDSFHSENLQKLVREVIRLVGDSITYFPAAQRLHHAERSGLLHHTTSMLNTAEHIIAAYPFLNGDLLRAGVIIHDLCKTVEMKSDEWGNVSDYTRDGLLIGHLVRGVTLIDRAAENVKVSGEMVVLLEHMVLSHHGEAEFGSPKLPAFPEAEVLHWIDLLDARMNEISGIMERTQEGEFSEKIWSLDNRRLYHPRYTDDAE